MKRLNHFLISIVVFLAAALFTSEVSAQIALVKNLTPNSSKTTGTSLALTVPAGGVAAGNSIIVSFAMDPATGTVSCTDSGKNSYAVDREQINGSGTSGVRTAIFSAHNVTALVSGNTITCTHPSVAARALSASEFSGLLASGAKDQATSATGSGTPPHPSSGNVTTTQASELLIGAIGVEGPSGDTFTPGASYTTTVRSGTTGGNALTNITINPEYRIVSATGAYAATATLGTSRKWGAAIVTYKAAPLVATKLVVTSVNSGANPTAGVGFAVVVQSQTTGGTPANVVNATGVSLSLKTGSGTLGGTLTGAIAAGTNQVTISGVTYTKAESGVVITATRTSGDNLTAGDSSAFTVVPGAATKVAFSTQPGNSTAGSVLSGPPTVVVQDSQGNTVTSSTASITVAIATNPGGGTLSGTTTKSAISGVANFGDLSIDKVGTGYTLTASSTGLTSATSNGFNISAATATMLVFSVQPTNSTVGIAIGGPPTVTVQDNFGNTITSSTASITIAIGTNPSGGTLSGTTTKNAVSGVVSFSDLKINQVGNGYTLTAASAGLTGVTSSPINVSASPGIVYVYDHLGRLRAVVDPASDTGIYNYDAVGNLLSISRHNSSIVSVIEFSPSSGPAGTTVTIFGTGFSATPGQNTVAFNGTTAAVVSSSPTQIVATVPAGATTGSIAVTTPSGSATSATVFTIGNLAAPTITGFTPSIGTTGTPVTITGTNFAATASANSLRFNLTPASASAATSTSLSTAVPTFTGSGRISVTTQFGKTVSGSYMFIAPPPFTSAAVESTGTITFGSDTTLTVATANNIALRVFEGVGGQIVTMNANNPTFGCNGMSVSILKPDNTQLSSGGVCGNTYFDAVSLSSTGTYTVMLTSNGGTTGQATLTLNSIANVTGTITADGTPVTAIVTTAGQRVLLRFSGTVGQKISALVTNSNIPGCWAARVSILKPDGSELNMTPMCGSGVFIEPITLPVTGTYTLMIDPELTSTGQATLQLFTVVDVTGTITTDGTPVTVSTATLGQRALLTFSGTAGQKISALVTNSNIPGCWAARVSVLKPDATELNMTPMCGSGVFIEPITLPVTGTYTLMIDPELTSTGQATLQLFTVVDVTGTITTDGTPVTVSTATLGQRALLTFSGTEGQKISGLVTNSNMPGCWAARVSVLKPDATELNMTPMCGSGAFIEPITLPVTGTYTLMIDPELTSTGQATLQLFTVVDVTGSVSVNGSSVPVSITIFGQRAILTFAGTIDQLVTVRITDNTMPWVTVDLKDINGNPLTSSGSGQPSFNLAAQTLPLTGTYSVVVDPLSMNLGNLSVSVTNP